MLPVQPTSKDSSNTKTTHIDRNFLQGRGEATEMEKKRKEKKRKEKKRKEKKRKEK